MCWQRELSHSYSKILSSDHQSMSVNGASLVRLRGYFWKKVNNMVLWWRWNFSWIGCLLLQSKMQSFLWYIILLGLPFWQSFYLKCLDISLIFRTLLRISSPYLALISASCLPPRTLNSAVQGFGFQLSERAVPFCVRVCMWVVG